MYNFTKERPLQVHGIFIACLLGYVRPYLLANIFLFLSRFHLSVVTYKLIFQMGYTFS